MVCKPGSKQGDILMCKIKRFADNTAVTVWCEECEAVFDDGQEALKHLLRTRHKMHGKIVFETVSAYTWTINKKLEGAPRELTLEELERGK